MTTAPKKTGPTTDPAVNAQVNNPAPDGVTMADTSALNGTPPPSGIRSAEQDATDKAREAVIDPDADVFVSEGMRHDLELHGAANDPLTGRKLTMDKRGKIKAEPRD